MKKLLKTLLAATIVLSFACAAATSVDFTKNVAEDSGVQSVYAETALSNYFYGQLDDNSKKFYNAIAAMKNDGTLKSGNGAYNLVANGVVTQSRVTSFQNGSELLLTEFAAARDAYFLDDPTLFYVDQSKLSLSLSLYDGEYRAFIDAGRNDSYFTEGFTADNIDEAIAAFNGKVNDCVNDINSSPKNTSAGIADKTAETVVMINEKIAEAVKYAYDFDEAWEGGMGSHIRTAYGALVNGYAVCDGYAKAFKAVADRLGVSCIENVGYYYDEGNPQPHAWNSVKISGKWYHVDPTMSDGLKDKSKFVLAGQEDIKNYETTAVISPSGFEFYYPAVATYAFNQEGVKTAVVETDGVQEIKYEYSALNYNNYGYSKYDNSLSMQNDGLYLIVRNEKTSGSVEGWNSYFCYYGDESGKLPFANYRKVQFAVTTQAPDLTEDGVNYAFYTDFDESQVIAKSDVIINENFDPTSLRPSVMEISPSATTVLNADTVYDISIKYDTELVKKDAGKDIGIYVYSVKSDNLNEYVTVENVRLEDGNTVKFKFTPSKMYEHDSLAYIFALINLTGKDSGEPREASLSFNRPWQVCDKIYDGGRLYVNSYGTPSLIDSSDLSLKGFTVDGEHVAEYQRSQLVLVAKKMTAEETSKMNESVADLIKSENAEATVESAATYEINLNICGGVVRIPAGSYVKVAFGFPQGYGPKDSGVTFKVYHFKRNSEGKIDDTIPPEEIECVVTEYGIVVTLNDFSPFMIAAVKGVNRDVKNVYAGNLINGSVKAYVTSNGVESERFGIVSLKQGETVRYEFAPNENYVTEYVLLNKTVKELSNGSLTLSYDELNYDNELRVGFVSETIYAYESERGIKSLDSQFLVNEGKTTSIEKDKVNVAIIIVVALLSILLIASLVFSVLLLKGSAKMEKRR